MVQPIRRSGLRLRDLIVPAVGVLALVYFGYHAVNGERGLLAWIERSEQIDDARIELAPLVAERQAIEHRVSLLGPESLDLDLLDERARDVLNLAKPNEITLFEPPATQ